VGPGRRKSNGLVWTNDHVCQMDDVWWMQSHGVGFQGLEQARMSKDRPLRLIDFSGIADVTPIKALKV
jgi:hypothetical protein